MIRQLETQDQYGNKIYRHTSSDIVWNLDTGHTVKEDIETLMSALGILESSGSGSRPEVNIDASTLSGYTIDQLVLKDTYTNAISALSQDISKRAPLVSPAFSGTPTVPNVDQGDSTSKIANTTYVDTAAAGVKSDIIKILEGYAKKAHSHSASDITSGTFASTSVYAKNGSDYTTARVRNISFLGSSENIPSALENGTMLAVYEG